MDLLRRSYNELRRNVARVFNALLQRFGTRRLLAIIGLVVIVIIGTMWSWFFLPNLVVLAALIYFGIDRLADWNIGFFKLNRNQSCQILRAGKFLYAVWVDADGNLLLQDVPNPPPDPSDFREPIHLWGGIFMFANPLIDRVGWKLTEKWDLVDKKPVPVEVSSLSLADQALEMELLESVETNDHVECRVRYSMKFRIVHPFKVFVMVDNYVGALRNRMAPAIRDFVNGIAYEEKVDVDRCLSNPAINQVKALVLSQWGIEIDEVSVEDLTPTDPELIKKLATRASTVIEAANIEKLAKAKRVERGLQAEGEREYIRLVFGTASKIPGGREMFTATQLVQTAQSESNTLIVSVPDIAEALRSTGGPGGGVVTDTILSAIRRAGSAFTMQEFEDLLRRNGLDDRQVQSIMAGFLQMQMGVTVTSAPAKKSRSRNPKNPRGGKP